MTVLLKLGGSAITDKETPETVDEETLDRAVDVIESSHEERLVVVHGGGSFGHHHASEHGVSTASGTREAAAVLAIHDAMKRLNDAVVGRLQNRGVPALPVHPLSTAYRDADGDLSLPSGQVAAMLDTGFVPVLHGDVIADRREGATVVSGDELMVELASTLDADRLGLLSTVPGVLDENRDVVSTIRTYEDVADILGSSDATDVTGGMAAKVETLLSLPVPAAIFGIDGLQAFLDGEFPGTRIEG